MVSIAGLSFLAGSVSSWVFETRSDSGSSRNPWHVSKSNVTSGKDMATGCCVSESESSAPLAGVSESAPHARSNRPRTARPAIDLFKLPTFDVYIHIRGILAHTQ